jgi:hypothetical protein
MKRKYWIGAAAGSFAGLMAASAHAAPLSTGGNDVRAATGDVSGVQNVHWDRDRRYYRGYYAPRRYYRGDYGHRVYRPYRYYGYGPGFGFYGGPRYYQRGWW